MDDLIFPEYNVPASVIPTCRGYLHLSAIISCAFTHIMTSDDLMLTTRLSYPISSMIRTLSSALSTRPSAVTPPYLAIMSFSSEPLFTPTRIGTLCSPAQSTTAFILSRLPILPGFIRILSAPFSIAMIAIR